MGFRTKDLLRAHEYHSGSGDTDFLIVGDRNVYEMEDPIALIEGAGYTDLVESPIGAGAYAYVTCGQAPARLVTGTVKGVTLPMAYGSTQIHQADNAARHNWRCHSLDDCLEVCWGVARTGDVCSCPWASTFCHDV